MFLVQRLSECHEVVDVSIVDHRQPKGVVDGEWLSLEYFIATLGGVSHMTHTGSPACLI